MLMLMKILFCYVMLTFKLVELTSKVQEQLVFQKNRAACDKSSGQGLKISLAISISKFRFLFCLQNWLAKNSCDKSLCPNTFIKVWADKPNRCWIQSAVKDARRARSSLTEIAVRKVGKFLSRQKARSVCLPSNTYQ